MTHPIVACASDRSGLLKAVAGVNPTFMSTEDKAAALTGLARVEAQVAELRLRVLVDAGDLAERTAGKDAAGWLAKETRTRFSDAAPRRSFPPSLAATASPSASAEPDASSAPASAKRS